MWEKEFNLDKECKYLDNLISRRETYKNMPELSQELEQMIRDQKDYIHKNK